MSLILLIFLAAPKIIAGRGAPRIAYAVQNLHNVDISTFVAFKSCHYPPLRAPARFIAATASRSPRLPSRARRREVLPF